MNDVTFNLGEAAKRHKAAYERGLTMSQAKLAVDTVLDALDHSQFETRRVVQNEYLTIYELYYTAEDSSPSRLLEYVIEAPDYGPVIGRWSSEVGGEKLRRVLGTIVLELEK